MRNVKNRRSSWRSRTHDSIWPQKGPAMSWPNSSTRMPSSGGLPYLLEMVVNLASRKLSCFHRKVKDTHDLDTERNICGLHSAERRMSFNRIRHMSVVSADQTKSALQLYTWHVLFYFRNYELVWRCGEARLRGPVYQHKACRREVCNLYTD